MMQQPHVAAPYAGTAEPARVASSNRLRVMIVNSTLHIGGAEQVAACLAEGIGRDDFEVSACYLKEPGVNADHMLRSGVDLVPIPGLVPGKRDYLSFLKLRRLIRQRRIEVIHTHDIHGLIDGSACRLTTPGLKHVHTWHFGNYPHRSAHHKRIEGALWRVPDTLIAVGHEQARSIRDLYGIPEKRMRVLWNGVADPRERRISTERFPGLRIDVPVIASISTLIPQKGLTHLLDAAALLRDTGESFQLAIVGGGVLEQPLREQAEKLRLGDHVKFLGWMAQANDRVLPSADIFVQSSIWEAMSIVVLEAMSAQKAMVVTSVGENPHVVKNGETGIVVPPANPAALADGLRRLLRDRDLRQEMALAARRRYEQTFTVGHMIAAHEKLYAELVHGARG
jgi:glycosyltransferase involved in cell wall biosynthesis